NCSGLHLISCMSRTSMPARSANATTRSTRARTELTFQVAIRMDPAYSSRVARRSVSGVGSPLEIVEEVVDRLPVVCLGAWCGGEVEPLDEVGVLAVRPQALDDLVGDLVDRALRVAVLEQAGPPQRARRKPVFEGLLCLRHVPSLVTDTTTPISGGLVRWAGFRAAAARN